MPQNKSKSYLPFVIILGVLAAVVGAGVWMWRGVRGEQPSASAPSSSSSPGARTGVAAATAAGAVPPHAKGAPQAVLTIEEFADLQCPLCATMNAELQKVVGEYNPRVRLVYRQFPLTTLHQNALPAALATEAAARQGKFWEMQDHLYRNQQAWSTVPDARQLFYDYARTLGLDADQFMRDMRSPEALARVRADMSRGNALGVNGTPTLYLNDRLLSASDSTPTGLRVAIDSALRAATPQR